MISKNDVNAQGRNAKNKAASAYIIVSLRPRLKHFCHVEQPMQQLAVDTVAMLPVKETMSSSFSRPRSTFRMRRIDFADFQRSISCWPPNSSNASSVLKASLLTWHPQLGHLLFTGEPVTHWIYIIHVVHIIHKKYAQTCKWTFLCGLFPKCEPWECAKICLKAGY
jgi:hypothetical protein